MVQTCTRCRETKPLPDFYLRGDGYGKTGRNSWCKECIKENLRYWRTQPERFRAIQRKSWVKQQFGLSENEVAALYEKQSGKCAICGGVDATVYNTGRTKRLNIDHNHKTKVVRGLLCTRCNQGIGLFRDDPEIMARAIKYLKGEI